MTTSADVVDALREAGSTVAVAESLTGGLVVADLVAVAGASDVVRGGVVAYAADLKASLLGVDAAHLERAGTVDAGTARQMAVGVRDRLGATYGLSTTGVAGPDPSEGHPPGTVYVAVASPTGTAVERLDLRGDRGEVRAAAVREALALLARTVQR
ncbi:MAG: CinA family protein [Nocardioidaceae bacterium]|nr:CinA family protein [Nocardioidaceae bacterium]